jgi:hypothetical protein
MRWTVDINYCIDKMTTVHESGKSVSPRPRFLLSPMQRLDSDLQLSKLQGLCSPQLHQRDP